MKLKYFLPVLAVLSISLTVSAETLTVYSAGPKGLSRSLVKGFEKETGTKVNLYQATGGKIMSRYQAEKSNPHVDVMISSSLGHAITLTKAGELLPYQSANAAHVPDSLKTDTYVAQGAAVLAIAYNTRSHVPAPKRWSDLARPEYKNQLTMPDPAKSGSALTLVEGLTEKMGNDAWQLFSDLKTNQILIPGANKAALNPVLQGAKSVVFGAVDYIALGLKAKGESLNVVYPEDGTVLAPRPIMILKSTRHEKLAKRFVDYILSDKGQNKVAGTLILPARTDIPAQRPGFADLNLIQFDSVAAAAHAKTTKARFADIMGR
ncbi:ABC transporter substrate-binding protein [Vibrio quintilis]|uniref:Phosphoglycerate transport regulatory protein PgtC n=1 Tax=Vibrio quintilis TaxID=1117707 RepID=A0A1M7YXZ7_9VIBR|nr:ABC transporter substrate-binding protein [Vibrio quintilis]SHO57559.1 Phosphoglycerate transport regulatory protein PgtC precursor [Vibrio quintilis]